MRHLIALFTALALPAVASAATLTIVPDKAGYLPGETITLTILGDGEGATAYSLFGRLVYEPALANPGTTTQNSAGSPPWVLGGPLEQGDGFADAFIQADFSAVGAPENFPGGVVSVVTLVAEGTGVIHVGWRDDLSFFGLTSAPGIEINVPEPTTAALLGLGLLALGICRGRERRSCER